MLKLGILFGGRSGEHEVSLMSAASVMRAVDQSRYQVVPIGITQEGTWLLYDGPAEKIEDGSWQKEAEAALAADPKAYGFTVLGSGGRTLKDLIDFALPILHGPYGEDGRLQGLLEMADLPYGGSGVTGSALAMDKILAKEIFAKNGLPQVSYLLVTAEDLKEEGDRQAQLDRVEEALPYPVFVKPANLGSSVGIRKARTRQELTRALLNAARYDRRLIVEQGISGRELETAILGNHKAEAGAVGEVIPSAEFYDYTAKYLDGGKSRICVPAEDVSAEICQEIRSLALTAYRLLDCAGFARVDFFLEQDTNQIYINEINTIPGFTKYSMFPRLWEAAGVPYPEQIERIVAFGYERYHAKDHR